MKRHPYSVAKSEYAWQYNKRRNYKEDKMETNSKVFRRKRMNKFQSWADGYTPIGLIRGRRERPNRYKKHRIRGRN